MRKLKIMAAIFTTLIATFAAAGIVSAQSALDRLEVQLQPPAATGATPATAQPATDPAKPYLGLIGDNAPRGIKVLSVKPDGPAAAGGILVDDLIEAVGGQPVASMDELAAALARHRGGEKIDIQITRQGQRRTMAITLGTRMPAVSANSPAAQPAAGAAPSRSPLLERVERLLDNVTARLPVAGAESPQSAAVPPTTPPAPAADSPFDNPPAAIQPPSEDPLAALSRQLNAILDRLDKIERRLQAMEDRSRP